MASYLDRFGPPPSLDEPSVSGQDALRRLEMGRAVQEAQKPQSPTEFTAAQQAGDILKSGAAGLGRGVVATPGLVGDVGMLTTYAPALGTYGYERARELTGYAPKGTAQQAYEKKLEETQSKMTEAEKTGKYSTIFGVNVPTGQYFVEKATPYVPGLTFEGQTPAGRVAGTVGEVLGSSLTTRGLGGLRGGVSGAKTAVKSAPALSTDVGAGLGAGIAGEAFRGSPDATLAQFAAAIPGAIAGRGVYSRFAPGAAAERGESLAGDIARQQLRDQDAAMRALETPQQYLPGIEPTTPQRLRGETGIAGLEREMAQSGTVGSGATAIAKERSQEGLARNIQRATEMAEAQKPFASMADAFNLPVGDNPRLTSSVQAQNLFKAVEEPMYQAAQQAWKHPAFENAIYDKGAVTGAIKEAMSSIPEVSRKQIPGELRSALDVLSKYQGYGVPFAEIQEAKKVANAIIRTPNANKTAAIAVTTKLDDLLTDMSKLSAKSPVGFDAPTAFDEARKATRNYKTLFESDLVKPFSERVDGKYAIQPEQMLDRVFGGSQNALARFRELQRIPGMDISGPASDWVVSKITRNGTSALTTSDDVSRFMREPGNAALVNEIPGLRDRLDSIVRQSKTEQVQQSFSNALQSNDMSRLGTYIENNRGLLNEVFQAPEQRAFINTLEKSAKILEKVPAGEMLDRRSLDLLMKGNLFTLLHGRATGKIAEAAAGAVAGKLAGAAFVPAAAFELATAGGLTGAFLPKAQSLLSRVVYGTTQEQALAALNRAMRDPEYMKFLMKKPTIENQLSLFNTLPYKYTATQAVPRGVLGQRDLTPTAPESQETTEQAYERLVREGKISPTNEITVNPRPRRASGGRTASNIAESLMRAADRAKRELGKETETLLNAPDEHIAKALDIAKRHI